MTSFAVAVSGALAIGAASCSSPIAHPAYAPQPTSALVEVTAPPPPARVEIVPERPQGPSVWIDGEWVWRRGRWAWLVGRWVLAPKDARFSPWAFVQAQNGTLWVAPGTWRDAQGAPIAAPRAMAVAAVQSADVVDAEGVAQSTGRTLSDRPSANSGPTE